GWRPRPPQARRRAESSALAPFERGRHRVVHGERERVLLLGTVHPDGADAVGVGIDYMLRHQLIRSSLCVRDVYCDSVTRRCLGRLANVVPEASRFGAAALEPRLDEGAEASYGFADDQRVHFARAFIGIDSFGVGNEATNMVLE